MGGAAPSTAPTFGTPLPGVMRAERAAALPDSAPMRVNSRTWYSSISRVHVNHSVAGSRPGRLVFMAAGRTGNGGDGVAPGAPPRSAMTRSAVRKRSASSWMACGRSGGRDNANAADCSPCPCGAVCGSDASTARTRSAASNTACHCRGLSTAPDEAAFRRSSALMVSETCIASHTRASSTGSSGIDRQACLSASRCPARLPLSTVEMYPGSSTRSSDSSYQL